MKKILLAFYTLFTVISSCAYVNGQDSCTALQKTTGPEWELGIQSGAALLIQASPNAEPNKYAFSQGVFIRKELTNNIDMKVEVNYASMKNSNSMKGAFMAKGIGKIYNLSIPVTVEYKVTLAKRLKAYGGAGIVFNSSQESYTLYNFKEGTVNNVRTIKTNASNASIIFTQEISYDISPRISIKESLHFIPRNACECKQYGINFGIGLKL